MDRNSITIRQMPWTFPLQSHPVIVEGEPEESFLYIGISLLLPHLEPYLIRSMVEAKKLITHSELKADIDAFNGQEGQHYRIHARFNKSLKLDKYTALKEHENKLMADYRQFTAKRSLKFNLAYAEGFEAFTLAMARYSVQTKSLDRVLPHASELFRWHMVEELEHRTVAFDVYQHLYGHYVYRLAVGIFAQWHLCRFALRTASLMKAADPQEFRASYGGTWPAIKRSSRLIWLAMTKLAPKVVATYMPWYTPHKIPMPIEVQILADKYSELARQTHDNSEVKR